MPVKWHATEPAPDEPSSADSEGHAIEVRPMHEPMPDEPGMDPNEIRGRASDLAPDELGSDDAEGHSISLR